MSALLRDITIGQYWPGNSYLHRLDPRTKIGATTLLVLLAFAVDRPLALAVFGVGVAGIYALSALPARMLGRGMRPLIIIVLVAVPLQLLFTPGEPLFFWGPVVVSKEGLVQSGLLVYRLIALVVITSLLTLTTPPVALTDGLERLLRPLERFRVPAHELAMVITIALRFIPLFAEEAEKIIKAQQSRGADFESGGLVKRMRAFTAVIVPLLVGAFRRADDLALAMEARCYRGGKGRTRLQEWEMGAKDYLLLLVMAAVLVAVLAGGW